jgi:hypothetical protein
VPNFAADIGLGILAFHHLTKRAPKVVVVNLMRHIEPPTVDAKANPMAGDFENEFAHRRRIGVELRQGRQPPPARVIGRLRPLRRIGLQRPIVHGEPIDVGAVAAVFENVMKLPKSSTRVIEYPIEHDAHVAVVRFVDEFAKRDIAPQQRVDTHVIVGVIAMVGGRRKDGGEVQGRDAQLFEIVELVDHAIQIAPLKSIVRGWAAPLLKLEPRQVLGARTTRKTIGKNLIKHRVLDPVGRMHRHFGRRRSKLVVVVFAHDDRSRIETVMQLVNRTPTATQH